MRALCVDLVMTAPFPPTTISHHYVPKRTDSVGLMEVDMEMVGAESVSLIVICAQILWRRAHRKASKAPKSRETVGEATLSDIRCNENPSVR